MKYLIGFLLLSSLSLNCFAVKACLSLLDAYISKAEYRGAFESCRQTLENHDRAMIYYRKYERKLAAQRELASLATND